MVHESNGELTSSNGVQWRKNIRVRRNIPAVDGEPRSGGLTQHAGWDCWMQTKRLIDQSVETGHFLKGLSVVSQSCIMDFAVQESGLVGVLGEAVEYRGYGAGYRVTIKWSRFSRVSRFLCSI